MTDTPLPVLLTRPHAQSVRFAKDLPGMRTVISPILRIEHRAPDRDPRDFDTLIFTSENGIHAAAAFCDLSGMRGYAVGPRTSEAGAMVGLDLKPAAGMADDLVPLIIRDQPAGRLLHLHGVHRRGNVVERLNAAGLETKSAICYDQLEQPLNAAARTLLAGDAPIVVPVFSPRSSALLGAMCKTAKAPIRLVAISPAALDAWTGPEPNRAVAVSVPSGQAMAAEILRQTGRAT